MIARNPARLGADRSERLLVVLGLVLTLVMVAMSYVPQDDVRTRPFDAVGVALLTVAAAALFVLRCAPLVSLAVSLATSAVWFPLGYAGAWPAVALLAAIYVVAREAATRRVIVAVLAVIAVSAGSMLTAGLRSFVTAVGILGWMAAAALLGDAVRQRRLLDDAHREQLDHVAAEQRATADAHLAEERLRIARDLHDVLAHTLTGIGLHAGAALDHLDRGHPAEQHVRDVRRLIGDAVGDVRHSIESLRTADARTTPTVPGWTAIPSLLDEARATGTNVTLDSDGLDLTTLPEMIGVCAYRLVQEAVTNIRRHSQTQRGTLRVGRQGESIIVCVEDPGPRRLPVGQPGFGLIGMNERVHSVGGELSVGSTGTGGFRVAAAFPIATSRA